MLTKAPIDAQAQAVLDGRRAAGAPPAWQLTAAENRAGFAPVRELIGPGPAMASVRDILIPGRAGEIPARVYTPERLAGGEPPMTIVYYHGGGWVIGSVDDWDAECRVLALRSGCPLISVDYRLAPEHAFPAATDDAYDAYIWVTSSEEFGRRGVVVAGDSAGGNLAAVTALRALHADGPMPFMQVLIYPVVDCDLDRESYHEFEGTEFIVNRPDMEWFWAQYAPDEASRRNPYASPLRAPSLAGLPPAYVLTAGHDPLRDEGFAYAERLEAAGVPVKHRHYPSQIHGFYTMVNVLHGADLAVADTAQQIRDPSWIEETWMREH